MNKLEIYCPTNPLKVTKVLSNELWVIDSFGAPFTIDPFTDGDVFECESFPYVPLFFARENTIKLIKDNK